jgi:sulfur carrier protein ThiS
METITKRTFSFDYKGQKYALSEDETLEDLLDRLGLKNTPVKIFITGEGFLLLNQ